MAASARKAAVELVEGAELDLDEPFAPVAPLPSRSWWDRLVRGWPIALVAVALVGVFVLVQVRESSRTEARLEALRAQLGYLEGIGPQMGVLWSVDMEPDEHLVGSTEDLAFMTGDDGVFRVVDLTTGAERWRVDPELGFQTYCAGSAEGPDGSTQVSCERYPAGGIEGADRSGYSIERRDAMTGEVLEVRELGDHRYLAWWGSGVLVLDAGGAGLELRREGLDGVVQWRLPVAGDPGSVAAWVDSVNDVAVVHAGRHLVVDRDGSVVLDVPEQADLGATGSEWLVPRRDGTFVRTSYVDGGERVEVLDSHGAHSFSARGYVAAPLVDDATVPGLVVVHEPWGIAVWDVATGETVVELDGAEHGDTLLLHGALVYQVEGELRAVDVRTGEERWHTRLDAPSLLGSDGDVVLYAHPGDPRELRAISARTGALAWTYPVGDATFPMVHSGSLLIYDGQALVRLGTRGSSA